jgi:hypothetical protein
VNVGSGPCGADVRLVCNPPSGNGYGTYGPDGFPCEAMTGSCVTAPVDGGPPSTCACDAGLLSCTPADAG